MSNDDVNPWHLTSLGGKMRRVLTFVVAIFALTAPVALAQQLYTNDRVDYSFDIPSSTWRTINEPDAAHEHP